MKKRGRRPLIKCNIEQVRAMAPKCSSLAELASAVGEPAPRFCGWLANVVKERRSIMAILQRQKLKIWLSPLFRSLDDGARSLSSAIKMAKEREGYTYKCHTIAPYLRKHLIEYHIFYYRCSCNRRIIREREKKRLRKIQDKKRAKICAQINELADKYGSPSAAARATGVSRQWMCIRFQQCGRRHLRGKELLRHLGDQVIADTYQRVGSGLRAAKALGVGEATLHPFIERLGLAPFYRGRIKFTYDVLIALSERYPSWMQAAKGEGVSYSGILLACRRHGIPTRLPTSYDHNKRQPRKKT